MGQRSTRQGRPHCEAFPALDILEAERSLRAGGGICEWRDERGVLVGDARLISLDELHVVFRYDFFGSPNIFAAADLLSIDVVCTRRNPNVLRKSFVCPPCKRPVQKIFFVSGVWRCRVCHDLVYLKQRLGNVNKKVNYRNELLADLRRVLPDGEHNREFRCQQRHLDRINYELAAERCASLPQELLYRTYQHWVAPSSVDRIGHPRQRVISVADSEKGGCAMTGLAAFRPRPIPLEPLQPCELVGLPILGRPFGPILTQHKADRSKQLRRDLWNEAGCPAEPMTIDVKTLVCRFAERIVIEPIVITSHWSDMGEVTGIDGRTEYAMTATYAGNPALWPAGPCVRPYKRAIRAILSESVIELRVRLPQTGKADPKADLDAARAEVERRLMRVEAAFQRLNVKRDQLALNWVRHNWHRNNRRLSIVRQPITNSI